MELRILSRDLKEIVYSAIEELESILIDDCKFPTQDDKDYAYLVTLELLAEKIKHYARYHGESCKLYKERYIK